MLLALGLLITVDRQIILGNLLSTGTALTSLAGGGARLLHAPLLLVEKRVLVSEEVLVVGLHV